VTWRLETERADEFRQSLEATGFTFESRAHQIFLARTDGVVVSLYENGKVVIGGGDERGIEAVEVLLRQLGSTIVEQVSKLYPPIDVSGTRIGTDEAGKGDYFGPLVIAGVLATEYQLGNLRSLGVRDSKLLSDSSVQNLAQGIRRILAPGQFDVITVSPAKYNSLYESSFHNVNGLLGWGHARVIENLLAFREPCEVAIADQFGDQSYIANALMRRARSIRLIQVPKAERDLAVAAASILARSGFIDKMREMGESFGVEFPKGASNVLEFARAFGVRYGMGGLRTVAKVHFVTTRRLGMLTSDPPPLDAGAPDPESLSPVHAERDQDTLRLECYALISSFERELRAYLRSRLQTHYESVWWERGIPREIASKARSLCSRERERGRSMEPIDCLDFDHYQWIITSRENWEGIFARDFGSKENVIARLTILRENRNPVSHSRPLEQRSKLEVISAIEYLRHQMSQRHLEDFPTAPPAPAGGRDPASSQ
jgi:ribonuclease HIII